MEKIPPLYLQGEESSGLKGVLHQLSGAQGFMVVEDASQARLILTVLGEKRDRRVLSVSTTGKVLEYELHYGIRFVVRDRSGESVLDDQSVDLVRDFSFEETAVLAKGSEQELLYEDMRRAAARQILRRLQAVLSR